MVVETCMMVSGSAEAKNTCRKSKGKWSKRGKKKRCKANRVKRTRTVSSHPVAVPPLLLNCCLSTLSPQPSRFSWSSVKKRYKDNRWILKPKTPYLVQRGLWGFCGDFTSAPTWYILHSSTEANQQCYWRHSSSLCISSYPQFETRRRDEARAYGRHYLFVPLASQPGSVALQEKTVDRKN